MIGNGVVIDLEVLFDELDALDARGVDTSRLLVSANAHVITQYHRTLDKVTERFLGKRQIGTTGRGIGPTYADKINRVGIRVQDLFDENILRQKVEGALDQKNHLLVKVYNRRAITVDEIVEELLAYAERLRPMVADTALLLQPRRSTRARPCCSRAARPPCSTSTTAPTRSSPPRTPTAGRRVHRLGHRADPHRPRHRRRQGVHDPRRRRARSRPSCSTSEGECLRETRLRVRHHDRAARAAAAGTTRRSPGTPPGSTASPTSCSPSSTCSPARDDPGLRRLRRRRRAPRRDAGSQTDFHHATPIYEEFPAGARTSPAPATFDDLPANAQDYVLALEEMSGARISAIGVGPGRDEIDRPATT